MSHQPRRIAVVGAGGFIGTNYCLHAAARGIQVRPFSRSFDWPLEARDGIEVIQAEIADDGRLEAAVAGCDAVLYLAVGARPRAVVDAVAEGAAVAGAIRLMQLCAAAGARLLFLSSAGAVYGFQDLVPTPEGAPCRPISFYGATCLAIEGYLHAAERALGLDYRVLRVANPYGPYQSSRKGQGVVAAFLAAALHGARPVEIWGDGKVVRDYLHIDDVLRAIDRALAYGGPARVFNIGSGEGTSLLDLLVAVERLRGQPIQRILRPGNPMDVPVSRPDISLARRELDWAPAIGLEEGLRRTVEWLAGPAYQLSPSRTLSNNER